MARRRPELKSVEYLINQASFRPRRAMPLESHQTYPIPVATRAGLRVLFLFCPTRVDPQHGVFVGEPTYFATLHADTGYFEEMRGFSGAGLILPTHENPLAIGTLHDATGLTEDNADEVRQRFCEQLDRILPVFSLVDEEPTVEERAAARNVALLAPVVLEKPLWPYYQAIGRAFWAWVEKASGAPIKW